MLDQEYHNKLLSKKTIIFIVGIVLVLIIGIAAAGAAGILMERYNPKFVVVNAFMGKSGKKEMSAGKNLFGEGLPCQKPVSSEKGGRLAIVSAPVSAELDRLAGAGLSFETYRDLKENTLSVNLGIGVAGANLAELKFYGDEERIFITSPQFTSRSFELDYTNDFLNRLVNSYFSSLTDEQTILLISQFTDSFGVYLSGQDTGFNYNRIAAGFNEYSSAMIDLVKVMKVERTEDKIFQIGDGTQSCKGYAVNIPKDSLIQLINDMKGYVMEEKIVQEEITKLMKYPFAFSALAARSFAVEDGRISEIWEIMDGYITVISDKLKQRVQDLTMHVYVDDSRRLVAVDAITSFKQVNEEVKVKYELTKAGGYSLSENLTAKLIVTDGIENITLNLLKIGNSTDSKMDNIYRFTASNNNYLNYQTDVFVRFDSETMAYETGLLLYENLSEVLNLRMDGDVEGYVKGKIFEQLNIDEFIVSHKEQKLLELKGYLYSRALSEAVKVPEGEIVNLADADEDQLGKAIYEIRYKLNPFLKSMIGSSGY